MNAEIFLTRLRQLEVDMLTLQRLANRVTNGHEDFTADAIHPIEPLSAAVFHAIDSAASSITTAVCVVDSWDKIREMCDDSVRGLNNV